MHHDASDLLYLTQFQIIESDEELQKNYSKLKKLRYSSEEKNKKILKLTCRSLTILQTLHQNLDHPSSTLFDKESRKS